MSGKSSQSPRRRKAHRKPHPDFPLTPHPSGRWCKKVKGKLRYFGPIKGDEDGQQALSRWLDQKDALLAGRDPRTTDNEISVARLCDHFLHQKNQLVDTGELAPRTFQRYKATCVLMTSALGRSTTVDTLGPTDFQALRGLMAKRWGPVALANEIQTVRSVFRYGEEAELFEKRVKFGPGFKKPSAKTLRAARSKKGPRLFKRDEIHAILEHSTVNMRAMILLAINGALGNTELALLPIKAVDLDTGWLDYPRAKTAVPRRVPLWPETIEAINESLEVRAEPTNPDDRAYLFIGPRGQNYVGNHKGYRVTQEFTRVCRKAGITDRTFYDLRRTFQTISEDCRDLTATQAIMGHSPPDSDMSARYRQRISDQRLQAVVEYVRGWLFSQTDDALGEPSVIRFPSVG